MSYSRLVARAEIRREPDGKYTTQVVRTGEYRVSLFGAPTVMAAAAAVGRLLTIVESGGEDGRGNAVGR